MNEMFIEVRDGIGGKTDNDSDTMKESNLQLNDFFQLLQNTECIEDAFIADEGIKELWKAHTDSNIRFSLNDGIANLLRGDKLAALTIYDNIVETDPGYMEAWNKKATCHYVSNGMILAHNFIYVGKNERILNSQFELHESKTKMLGDNPQSISAADKAGKINEMHYQTHAGLGLVYSDMNQYEKAAQALRKTLSLNPWSPASSRLNICLDKMNRLGLEEDKLK